MLIYRMISECSNMTYSYLLKKEERNNKFFYVYKQTDPKLNFYRNSSKIATMLILSEKVHEMAYDLFDIDDKRLFSEMGSMSYYSVDLKINDMKEYSIEILKEQSIIAAVSNWEGYFSDICEIILNDDNFIQKIYKDKDKQQLRTFLNHFNLMQVFNNEVLLNENKTDGLKFGSYLRKNKKINFQNIDDLKAINQILYEIKFQIDDIGWKEIIQLIQDRHKIVHNPNSQKIVDNYSKDKIERIIMNMSKIIDHVDECLFTNDD